MTYEWPKEFENRMSKFLEPRSIAVIGATEGLGYGGRMVDNLRSCGFQGKIFPVNPKRSEIKGLVCYPSLLEIKEPVDLAAIIIPADSVQDALVQCKNKGIQSVIIISSNFSERDGEGADRQNRLKLFAAEHGIYICGPNCLGVANINEKIMATAASALTTLLPEAGRIAIVSQSGATAFGPLLAKAKDRGVGLKYIVSTGNEVNLEVVDFIRYILDDPEVNVIAAFIEGFKDGEKLKTVADLALKREKPIIMMKMGRSDIGSRAAQTHTAAIAGSFEIQKGFFRQKGVCLVDDYDELCETANLFSKGKYPKGERVCVISHGGGICTFLSDECASAGFQIPSLTNETTKIIEEILKGWGSAKNPLDLTQSTHGSRFPDILCAVLNDPNIDSVILATRGNREYIKTVAQIATKTSKPLLFVWTHSEFDSDGLISLREEGLPVFISPVKCVKALRHLREYEKIIHRHYAVDFERVSTKLPPISDQSIEYLRNSLIMEPCNALTEGRCREILSPLDLPFGPSEHCQTFEEVEAHARHFGYPVVLKMDSPQILHKTECKGVYLNITDETELTRAFDHLTACRREMSPQIKLNGIMVQKMISEGIELILGVSEDPLLGPTIMLGWGGIFVETFAIGAWRVCPIEPKDADEMIKELPGLRKMIEGVRGNPPLDYSALVDHMVRVSEIAYRLRDLVSALEFNPIKLLPDGQGVRFLDCRMILRTEARTKIAEK